MIIRCSFIICLLVLVNASVFGQKRDTCCADKIEFVDQIITENPERMVRKPSPFDSLLSKFSERDRYEFERLLDTRKVTMRDDLLSKVPVSILEKSRIESLTLVSASQEKFFSNFYKLKSLKKLKLLHMSLYDIKGLPKELPLLNTLEELYVYFDTKELSSEVTLEQLKNLKKAGIYVPNLQVTPKAIIKNSSIKELKLIVGENSDTVLLDFEDLIGLEFLKVTSGANVLNINNLPTSIKSLELSLKKREYLPEEFYTLKNLEKLVIFGTKLARLSSSIKALTNLKELVIYTEVPFKVPKEINKLTKLDKIQIEASKAIFEPNIIYPQIKKFRYGKGVVEDLSQFSNLEALWINAGKDNALPNLRSLKKLKYIKIISWDLKTLPDYIFTELKSLEEVDLSEASSELSEMGNYLRKKYPNIRIRLDRFADAHFPPPPKF